MKRPSLPYTALGAFLRELRFKSSLTQREVSVALGYSSAQVLSNFERGMVRPPMKKLKALITLYRIDDVNRLIDLMLQGERGIIASGLGPRAERPSVPKITLKPDSFRMPKRGQISGSYQPSSYVTI